jgi:hypothetical protein
MRKSVLLLVLLVASVSLSACAHGYPGFDTPRATLDTFFGSAARTDYSTVYDCYDRRYRAAVQRAEFTSHRSQASILKDYHIDSLTVDGNSANAVVRLTFASGQGVAGSTPSAATVRENLVNESGSWKIRVW